MNNWVSIATVAGETVAFLATLVPIIVCILKIMQGVKCQLRSEMLRIYYHNKDSEKIRQYEAENFILLYNAYKALKGNSFIDKIHAEVISWEVVT